LEQKLALFWTATSPGNQDFTDKYFRESILPDLTPAHVSPHIFGVLKKMLAAKRFGSFILEVQAAQAALEPQIIQMEKAVAEGSSQDRNVIGLIDLVEEMAPRGSAQKDQFLEELSWRLQIEDRKILGYLESLKSMNWKRANPVFVNIGSSLTKLVAEMTYSDRLDTIAYFLDPNTTPLPLFFRNKIKQGGGRRKRTMGKGSYVASVKPAEDGVLELVFPATLKRQSIFRDKSDNDSSADIAADKLIAILSELRPFELIPVFEFLLDTGERRVSNDLRFQTKIIRRFLKHDAEGKKEKYLLAFLNRRKFYTRATALAYMLASSMDASAKSQNSIFEIFGSMGIVGAQMGSILGYLDNNASDLKDNATPLSRATIIELLDQYLPPQERARVKRVVGILGSASVSTAVELELDDGSRAVALIQRPYAREQIISNAKFLRGFARDLSVVDKEFPLTVALNIIDVAEQQLLEELEMIKTGHKIQSAQAFYNTMNRVLSRELKGWKFNVPSLIAGFSPNDKILIIEKIEGETFDKMSAGPAKETVGYAIAKSSVRGFFGDAFFCEDRHARNVKVDSQRMLINMFDFGKSGYRRIRGPLARDDRYQFARLFEAMNRRDLGRVVDNSLTLSEESDGSPIHVTDGRSAELRAKIDGAIRASSGIQEELIGMKTAFDKEGIVFPRRGLLGSMKGLIVVSEERYVEPDIFRRIVSDEIQRLFIRKSPVLALDALADWRLAPSNSPGSVRRAVDFCGSLLTHSSSRH
jgi:hypothetical protein